MRIIEYKTPPKPKPKKEDIEIKFRCDNCESILGVNEKDCTIKQILQPASMCSADFYCFECPVCNITNECHFQKFQTAQMRESVRLQSTQEF